MQCQSYLPLYYTHNDRNVDDNGGARPVYTGHAKPPTGLFNPTFLNLHVTEGYHLGYGKELLRQTILQQEVTFKNQVQELHRLYRRQRELLDEIKRTNVYKTNVLTEVQWPASLSTSNVSFSSDRLAARSIPFDSFAVSYAPAFGENIIQTPWTSTKGESIPTASHVSKNVRSSNALDLSLSQSSIPQRKLLDLQLPADEYINNEGKALNSFDVSRMSILSNHTSNRDCPLAPLSNTKPLFVSSCPITFPSQIFDLANFSGSKHMHSGTLCDHPDKKKMKMCNTDGLQRWQPRGDDVGRSGSGLNTSGFFSYSESLQRLAAACQGHQRAPLFPKNGGWPENERRNTDANISGSIHEMLNLNSPGHAGGLHRPILEFSAAHSSKVNPRVPSSSSCGLVDLTIEESLVSQEVPFLAPNFSAAVSQAPCVDEFVRTSNCGTIYEKGRCLQVSCSESNVKASSASSDFLFPSSKCELASADNGTAKQTNSLNSIDLNSPSSTVALKERHVGLGVDLSTFNRIHGLSEETALLSSTNVDQEEAEHGKKSRLFDINLPCHLTAHMDHHPIADVKPSSVSSRNVEEVDLEASIMPISPEKQECRRPRGESEENKTEMSLQLSSREDGEDSMDDEVMKIAADVLVCISSSDSEQSSNGSEQCQASTNELLIWFAQVVCSEEKISPFTGIDYFEAMTLKLTDTSEEDYRSTNAAPLHSVKEMCDAPLSVELSSGRTTKRRKRRNFQSEILPSLASLSRYEVSEDIQIIEKLMETVGTTLQLGVKTRKNGGKRRLKGRKKMHTTAALWERRKYLLALPHMGIAAVDLKDKGRVRWENMPKQRRGPRCRTVFPNVTLSQEGWMRKWGVNGFVQKGKKKRKQGELVVPQER